MTVTYPGTLIGVVICYCFGTGITCLRFGLRDRGRRLNRSEFAIIFSQFMFTGFFADSIINLVYLQQNSIATFTGFAKLNFTAIVLFLATIWSIKISINLLCWDLSRGQESNIHRNSIYTLVFVVCSGIAAIGLNFSCLPSGGNSPTAGCNPVVVSRIFCAVFALHVISNILIFILPFPLIRSLANQHLRYALFVIFGLAILATVMSVMNFAFVWTFQGSLATVVILTNIECCLCMNIASLPAMSKPLTRYFQRRGNDASQILSHDYDPAGSGNSDSTRAGTISTTKSSGKSSTAPSQDMMQSTTASNGKQGFIGSAHSVDV